MGTYKLSQNERYKFAASAGTPVMTFASDGVGGTTVFRNKIKIKWSNNCKFRYSCWVDNKFRQLDFNSW